MQAQVEEVIRSYMERIEKRRGLSRSMNHSMRTYPQVPDIIRRTVLLLARTEMLFGTPVQMRRLEMYRSLMQTEDDWVREVPVAKPLRRIDAGVHLVDPDHWEMNLPDHDTCVRTVDFERRPLFDFNTFQAAMTIARRVGLIAGHGRNGLDPVVRKRLQGAMATAQTRRPTDPGHGENAAS